VKRAWLSAALALVAYASACPAQTAPDNQGMGEMTGRDDSPTDHRPFMADHFPEELDPILRSESGIRVFGWLDGGVSTMSNAAGLVSEAPTPDRFSNQPMLNAAWIAIEKPTTQSFSWGFRTDFFAGSDPALLRSLNHFGPSGPRWGTDFRQAYISLHTPIVFSRGIDWTFGRITFPTGAETVMAPYQALYSRGYFWIHGATSGTAVFSTSHVNSQLDVVAGTTMGYGTTYILRGRAPDYLARILYHPATKLKQQFVATVYAGPKPLATAPGHAGTWQNLFELQAREVWTQRFNQAFQVSYIADQRDPAEAHRSSAAKGAFLLNTYKINRAVSLNSRLEWFDDPHGTRAVIPGVYSDAAAGLTFYPNAWCELRPEIRGDFAGQNSFGASDSGIRRRNQLTAALEVLFKGRVF
jgi:hypothetical protein